MQEYTRLISMIQNIEYKERRLEQMLSKIHWPFPGHIGAKYLDDVAGYYLSGTLSKEDVEEIFIKLYRRARLENLWKDWKAEPVLETRLPILEEILWAHRNERYYLSICVMIAQIEGFVAEIKQHKKRLTIQHLEYYINDMLKKGTRFEKYISKFIINTIWEEFYHGWPLPDLSRHAILHGADLKYGTAANSLRIILTFNSLQEGVSRCLHSKGKEPE